MKKITSILLISALIIGTRAIGSTVVKAVPVKAEQQAVQTTRELALPEVKEKCETPAEDSDITEIKSELTEELISDLRECKPYDEKIDFDFLGVKLSFKIKINGWVDNKCVYNISGKINELSKDFRKSFGITIPNSEISKIEPQVVCEFNKEQLNSVVNAVIEEDKRSTELINKMLKDPQETYTIPTANDLTPQEKELMRIITEENACTVPNIDELMQQFSKLGEQQK